MQKKSRERFVDLAESRVNSAIKTIRLIGNLSNKSNYSYEKIDIDKIFKALETELKICKSRFSDSSGKPDNEFKL